MSALAQDADRYSFDQVLIRPNLMISRESEQPVPSGFCKKRKLNAWLVAPWRYSAIRANRDSNRTTDRNRNDCFCFRTGRSLSSKHKNVRTKTKTKTRTYRARPA
jgi:hypothetical protein